MKAAIIYNPMAGHLRNAPLIERAARQLRHHGWDVVIVQTSRAGEVGSLVRAAAEAGAEVIFAAGGDGTLGAAAHALAGSEVALGVLPIGTANVWAAELGLPHLSLRNPQALHLAVAGQVQGDTRRVDLGCFNGRHFLLWAGVGLDAHIVRQIEPRSRLARTFGVLHYALAAVRAARGWRGRVMTVRTENGAAMGQTLLALVSNVRRYAGGLAVLDSEERVDDGLLSVWVCEGKGFGDAWSM